MATPGRASPTAHPRRQRLHKLNVAYGERIRFVAESGDAPERSFTWKFDVLPEGNSFGLSQVAPADFPTYSVRIYVSPDPLYIGG